MNIDLGNVTFDEETIKKDPRFPLFKHMMEVHKWNTPTAFNYCNSMLGQQDIKNDTCPQCGHKLREVIIVN